MTDGVCEHATGVEVRMKMGCVRADVYSKCVTLAEVNKSRVTVTEECVLMIPATPSVCVRVGST